MGYQFSHSSLGYPVASRQAVNKNAVDERAQHFLKILIERYIREGEPVGSRTLAREAGHDLSPATIRNVMADLEEMGLVSSPHTSSGRVPTVNGYRLFVDSLLNVNPLADLEVTRLKEQFQLDRSSPDLIASASQMLSAVTHMAGVVMMPRSDHVSLRQIEFLPLSSKRVLAILITNEEEVINRIVNTQHDYSAAELEQAANYINHTCAGRSIPVVRDTLLKEMRETRVGMDKIMVRALEMAEQLFDPLEEKDDCLIAGQTNLMDFDELVKMEQLRGLFDAFIEKQQILHLLDECLQADGVQIFIGEESGFSPLGNCSVVMAPYEVNNEVVGVLGVIGPTRMAYDRVIPVVDVTAKLLGAALKQR